MISFFAGWLVVGGAVFSFLLLFCVSSEIASVCTCSCRTCKGVKESGAPGLNLCSALMEQVAVYGARAVYRLCDVWGRLSSPNKAWERQRGTQQCHVCLDGGGLLYGDGILDQVPGSSAIPAEADSAGKSNDF